MSGWAFDMEIRCPFCGGHQLKYSAMGCPKFGETLNEKYFIILKFLELEYKIKELEKLNDKFKNEHEEVEEAQAEA